jgi:23S rRNA pseudouridine955/2504/2580 synthase
MSELKVGPDCDGWRLDRFIRQSLPGMPLSHIFKLFRTGKVRLDGKKSGAADRIASGQVVIVHIPEDRFSKDSYIPSGKHPGRVVPPFKVEVLYEDADLVAINKPAGVPVHPGSGYAAGTCIDRIHEYLGHKRGPGVFSPALVHRLDADTSGVLVAAKNYDSLRVLARAFEMRRVEKMYLALAGGRLPAASGVIEMAVRRLDGPDREREPRSAVTEYAVAATVEKEAEGKVLPLALLELRIQTGRTHQIRSHLKDIGAPVVGDSLYGDDDLNRLVKTGSGLARQFLHARRLAFRHPSNGTRLAIEAPLPEDLKKALDWAGLKI